MTTLLPPVIDTRALDEVPQLVAAGLAALATRDQALTAILTRPWRDEFGVLRCPRCGHPSADPCSWQGKFWPALERARAGCTCHQEAAA